MDSAALLDLLGNENRRRILRLLARRPCYVTEISDALDVSPKAVIDHLRKLEDAGVIECRVNDQRRKYFRIARNLRLEVTVSPYGFGTKSAYPAGSGLDLTACTHLTLDTETALATERSAAKRRDATEGRANAGTTPAREPPDPDDGVGEGHDGDGVAEDDDSDDNDDGTADRQRRAEREHHAEHGDGRASWERATDADDTDAVRGTSASDAAAALARDLHRLEQLERELSLAQRWVQGRRTAVMDRLTGRVEERTASTDGFAIDGDARLWAEILGAIAGGASTPRAIADRVSAPRGVVRDALGSMERRGFVRRSSDGWEIRS